ncbi:sel1 repeat family protein [Burkholderia sp. R-69980]|nr:sel1 repeat family protein [Burkholderia sp. R-69980]
MRYPLLVSLFVVLASGCSNRGDALPWDAALGNIRVNLAFTCTHEADRLPALDPDADVMFRYGRYLQTRDGPKNFDDMARYYRIAAAHGHYKANHNVQQLVSQGMASSPGAAREAVEWATQLVNQGIPTGYYDIGYYLNSGYGLKQNREMALKYIRKAADLGNADAQYYVADLLFPHDKAPDIARQMQQCAADQGHGKAALELGTDLKYIKQYHDALSALQKGVAAGNSISAMVLEKSFLAPPATDEGFYLGLPDDPERSRRYKLIGNFLDRNQLSNPTVPDIDRIVPLPPAQLPAWDGTFEWEKKQAEIPPKPSDELINRLAQEKNLDPATGLPVSAAASQTSQTGKPAKLARVPLGTKVRAGARCPESGEWCTQILAELRGETTQYFRKGETLPMLDVYRPRIFVWLDDVLGKRRYTTDVIWTLTAYKDKA